MKKKTQREQLNSPSEVLSFQTGTVSVLCPFFVALGDVQSYEINDLAYALCSDATVFSTGIG